MTECGLNLIIHIRIRIKKYMTKQLKIESKVINR